MASNYYEPPMHDLPITARMDPVEPQRPYIVLSASGPKREALCTVNISPTSVKRIENDTGLKLIPGNNWNG